MTPTYAMNCRKEVVSLGGQNVLYFMVSLPAFGLEGDIIFILLDGQPTCHLQR